MPPNHPNPHHYENFPVASWLCPAALRPPIQAIYWFARVADDLADEGNVPSFERLQALQDYRMALLQTTGELPSPRGENTLWPQVFFPLKQAIDEFKLPTQPLLDLLQAFEQDVRQTESKAGYPDMAALHDYCEKSANPIGRLLLHLYGIQDPMHLSHSDCICTALQLINFWQDLSVDIPRKRYYLPQHMAARLEVPIHTPPQTPKQWAHAQTLLMELLDHSQNLMRNGAPLCKAIPGRAGWELRLVVQGGLRILEKIEHLGTQVWLQRPTLNKADAPLLLWRAVQM